MVFQETHLESIFTLGRLVLLDVFFENALDHPDLRFDIPGTQMTLVLIGKGLVLGG